jgi:hypothetical protein
MSATCHSMVSSTMVNHTHTRLLSHSVNCSGNKTMLRLLQQKRPRPCPAAAQAERQYHAHIPQYASMGLASSKRDALHKVHKLCQTPSIHGDPAMEVSLPQARSVTSQLLQQQCCAHSLLAPTVHTDSTTSRSFAKLVLHKGSACGCKSKSWCCTRAVPADATVEKAAALGSGAAT